jgi:hypothetical protein
MNKPKLAISFSGGRITGQSYYNMQQQQQCDTAGFKASKQAEFA